MATYILRDDADKALFSGEARSWRDTVNQAINNEISLAGLVPPSYVRMLYGINPGEGTDLRRAHFSTLDCSGVDFSGADLSGADFSYANITSSCFDDTNLTGANLTKVQIDLTTFKNANLTNLKADEYTFEYLKDNGYIAQSKEDFYDDASDYQDDEPTDFGDASNYDEALVHRIRRVLGESD